MVKLSSLTFENSITFYYEKFEKLPTGYTIFFAGVIDPRTGFYHCLFYLPGF